MTGRTTEAIGRPLDPAIADLTGETLVELLDRACDRTPGAVALVIRRGMADERWTYRDLRERSTRVAANLRVRGIGAGDRVVTWSQNDPWLVAAYFAAWRLGAIIVPLDLRMQTDVAVRIGARTEPAILLAGADVDPDAAAALGVPIVSVDEAGLAPADVEVEPFVGTVDPTSTAEILFTSGTTSDPKGVVLSHGAIVHTARAIAQAGMGPEPERALGIIPLSHMYGQSVPLLLSLISDSTLVFLHALTPKSIRATMQRERVTAVTLVPQLISIVMDGIESEARRTGREKRLLRARRIARYLPTRLRRLLFRSVLAALGGELRVISSGGARLPEDLQRSWEAMGVAIVQGYGTTECAAICGHTRWRQRVGTVGPPLAGIEVRIADDGELLVRGPNLMDGYWHDPDATAEVLDDDGWLHTGDAASIDADGEITILGRTRDRIALPNGFNVYPEDLEAALRETDAIRDAVAFEPMPGRLAAALIPTEDRADDAELDAAVSAANASLAPHQRIGAWRRWPDDDFPRTHTLKVRRKPVQEWYVSDDDGRDPGPATPPTEGEAPEVAGGDSDLDRLIAITTEVVAEHRGSAPPPITASTTIDELELDSLTVVSLSLRIDEAFDAPLTDDEVAGATDIEALLELVQERQGQPAPTPPSRWAYSGPARRVRRVLDATLTGWAIRIVTRPRFEGLEHLDAIDGPVLICPDHTSHLDAPLVRAGLPGRLRDEVAIAAAADYWFEGNLAGPPVALALGAFPFGRTSDIRASMEFVAELVNAGTSVIIFPEGQRSSDGRVGPMRSGIGLLATGLRVPVVPVHIAGAREILPKGSWLPRHRRGRGIVVRYGPALRFDASTDVQAATDAIGAGIANLREGSQPTDARR